MDIESVIKFKLFMFSGAWLLLSPFYMLATKQEFTLKVMAIVLAPAIIFATWFMVFYWG